MLKNLKVERALKNKLLLDHDKKLGRKLKNGIKEVMKKQELLEPSAINQNLRKILIFLLWQTNCSCRKLAKK